MVVILIAYIQGKDIMANPDAGSLFMDGLNPLWLKGYIGLSHVLTFIVGPLIFAFIYYKGHIKDYFQLKGFNPKLLMFFIIALYALYPAMGYLTYYIQQIDFPDFLKVMDDEALSALAEIIKMDNLGDLMINLLIIGIIPGIGEEMLFRGIIQKELTSFNRKPHLSIFITAILFALFHFQVTGLASKFLIGMVLGYAYHYSGSLILPMILHALNNSIATIAYYFSPENLLDKGVDNTPIPWMPVVLFTAIFGLVMYYIDRLSKEEPRTDNNLTQ